MPYHINIRNKWSDIALVHMVHNRQFILTKAESFQRYEREKKFICLFVCLFEHNINLGLQQQVVCESEFQTFDLLNRHANPLGAYTISTQCIYIHRRSSVFRLVHIIQPTYPTL